MILTVQAQAFEARKGWMHRLVVAKMRKLTCNLGPTPDPLDLPSGNRSWGHLRAHVDDALVPGLPGMALPPTDRPGGYRVPCSGHG